MANRRKTHERGTGFEFAQPLSVCQDELSHSGYDLGHAPVRRRIKIEPPLEK